MRKQLRKNWDLGGRINTVMQTCFFMLTSLMPFEFAIDKIRDSIRKTYGRRGESIVNRICRQLNGYKVRLHEVKYSP